MKNYGVKFEESRYDVFCYIIIVVVKRVFLIHGWEGYPEEGWKPWLRKELEGKGFEVIIPAMPDTATPTFDKWVPYLAQTVGTPDENTYFVCHSLGCITTLRYLETLKENQKIGGVVLVAGFGRDLEYEGYKGELTTFFATPIDWNKIKNACKKFVVIHSDDDEWVPVKFGEELAKNLESPFILEHGMKHFSGDDGITEAPVILENLLKIAK